MNVTILGGTGGVGRRLVTQALEAGHAVTAYARNPDKLPSVDQLSVVEGELDDLARMAQAFEGADAVLSALGARTNTPEQVEIFETATRNIIAGMQQHGVHRLIAISGAGVITPEDHLDLPRKFVGLLLKLFAKHVARAKEREYELIRDSDLDWTLVRPPRIVEGERTGTYRVLPDRVPSPKISQGDVADLMLRCLSSSEWSRRAPIPGY